MRGGVRHLERLEQLERLVQLADQFQARPYRWIALQRPLWQSPTSG